MQAYRWCIASIGHFGWGIAPPNGRSAAPPLRTIIPSIYASYQRCIPSIQAVFQTIVVNLNTTHNRPLFQEFRHHARPLSLIQTPHIIDHHSKNLCTVPDPRFHVKKVSFSGNN